MLLFDQRYAVRSLGSPPTTHPWLLDSAPFRANAARVKPVVLPEGHDVHSSRLFSPPSRYLQLFLCFISVHHPWLLSVIRPFIIPLFLPHSVHIAGTAAALLALLSNRYTESTKAICSRMAEEHQEIASIAGNILAKNIFFHHTIIDSAVFTQRGGRMPLYSSTYGRQLPRRHLNSGFQSAGQNILE